MLYWAELHKIGIVIRNAGLAANRRPTRVSRYPLIPSTSFDPGFDLRVLDGSIHFSHCERHLPAQVFIGSASVLLTMIRVRPDYVDLGRAGGDVLESRRRGMPSALPQIGGETIVGSTSPFSLVEL